MINLQNRRDGNQPHDNRHRRDIRRVERVLLVAAFIGPEVKPPHFGADRPGVHLPQAGGEQRHKERRHQLHLFDDVTGVVFDPSRPLGVLNVVELGGEQRHKPEGGRDDEGVPVGDVQLFDQRPAEVAHLGDREEEHQRQHRRHHPQAEKQGARKPAGRHNRHRADPEQRVARPDEKQLDDKHKEPEN